MCFLLIQRQDLLHERNCNLHAKVPCQNIAERRMFILAQSLDSSHIREKYLAFFKESRISSRTDLAAG